MSFEDDVEALKDDLNRQVQEQRRILNEELAKLHERNERRAQAENEFAQMIRPDLDALGNQL